MNIVFTGCPNSEGWGWTGDLGRTHVGQETMLGNEIIICALMKSLLGANPVDTGVG